MALEDGLLGASWGVLAASSQDRCRVLLKADALVLHWLPTFFSIRTDLLTKKHPLQRNSPDKETGLLKVPSRPITNEYQEGGLFG